LSVLAVKVQILYRARPMLTRKAWIRCEKIRVGALAYLFCDKTRHKFLSHSIFSI